MSLEDITNAELQKKLDEGAMVEGMLSHPGWEVVTEAMKRVVESWGNELRTISPTDVEGIIRLQERIKLADDFLPSVINSIRQDGFAAFQLDVRNKDE